MSIKNKLYRIKKQYMDKQAPKISVPNHCEIAVIEYADEEMFSTLFPKYTVVNNLNKICASDYSKISVYMGAPEKSKLIHMSSLKWIQLSSAGLNGYDDKSLYCKMPMITTAKGIYGVPISECVIADILFLMKPALSNCVNKKHKIPPTDGLEMENCSAIVCGLGDIGRNVAVRLKGMNCKSVIGIDTYIPEGNIVDAVFPLDKLAEVIGKADIVVSALPDLPQTRSIYNTDMFGRMKKNAVFVNVGRGSAVDQQALIAAVKTGHLFGAALDVTTPDPISTFHPLRRTGRILITDHLACISRNNSQKLQTFYFEQAKKYINGELQ